MLETIINLQLQKPNCILYVLYLEFFQMTKNNKDLRKDAHFICEKKTKENIEI